MKQVCVLGCGPMGTVLSNLVAKRVLELPDYQKKILWYIREERYNNDRLIDVIANCRENHRYFPGYKIEENVVPCDDICLVAASADVLLFAYAARCVNEILQLIGSMLKPEVIFISFCKGFVVPNEWRSKESIRLVSEEVRRITGIRSAVISGAMTARGLAECEFAEVTLGCLFPKVSEEVKRLLESENLRLTWTDDVTTVELCGALKNILSIAAGIVDGLKLGSNTKSTIIRLGLYEIGQYCQFMYMKFGLLRQSDVMPVLGDDWDNFNLLIGKRLSLPEYAGMSVDEIEKSLHPNLLASGPDIASKIYAQLSASRLCERFPLFTAVHLICIRSIPATMLVPMLRYHPAHQ